MARRSTRSPTGHTILAVDDQQDSLVSVRNLLEREGHRVLTAESGEQALVVLKTTEVDLMIVDYVMPRMNGAQLVRAVRGFDPFVQIILQTGYAGVESVRQEWVDVGELAREMQRLAGPLLEDRGVAFALELALAPPRFLTDATKLRTILRNLIINAAKFTAAGTVALRIVQRGGALRLEVRDTGPGIRPEDQELIFEPFRQLDGSSTRQHGGVGLGLALSRRLARMLGGDVQIQSEPGVGSTFALVLPAEAAGLGQSPAPPRLVSHA